MTLIAVIIASRVKINRLYNTRIFLVWLSANKQTQQRLLSGQKTLIDPQQKEVNLQIIAVGADCGQKNKQQERVKRSLNGLHEDWTKCFLTRGPKPELQPRSIWLSVTNQ